MTEKRVEMTRSEGFKESRIQKSEGFKESRIQKSEGFKESRIQGFKWRKPKEAKRIATHLTF
jgi:hypothetical protein